MKHLDVFVWQSRTTSPGTVGKMSLFRQECVTNSHRRRAADGRALSYFFLKKKCVILNKLSAKTSVKGEEEREDVRWEGAAADYRRAAESWAADFGETRCRAGLSVTSRVCFSGRRRVVLSGFPSPEVSGGPSLGQPSAELFLTEQAVV